MTYIILTLAGLIVYLCIYSIIDRILRCIERCAEIKAKTYLKIHENSDSEKREMTAAEWLNSASWQKKG